MNNTELEAKIKALRVPSREEDYWETFAQQVIRKAQAPAPASYEPRPFIPQFAWSLALALICLFTGFFLGRTHVPQTIAHKTTAIHQDMLQFQARVTRLMQNEHGQHHLVEDQL